MKTKHHITYRQIEKRTRKDALLVAEALYTEEGVQAAIQADRDQFKDYMAAQAFGFLTYYDTIARAVMLTRSPEAAIYGTLALAATNGWKAHVRGLRDEFNRHATQSLDALNHLTANAYLDDERSRQVILQACAEARQTIMTRAGELNDAVSAALTTDDVSKLQTLAESFDHDSFSTLLLEKLQRLSTEHLAQDTRADRGGVYIGVHAYLLETEQGVTSVERQWRHIYAELKTNRAYLEGDALAAWEYFQRWKPFTLHGESLRTFQQEINRLKNKAGRYIEAATNSRQTHDMSQADLR